MLFSQVIKFANHLGQTKTGVAKAPYRLQPYISNQIDQYTSTITRDLYVNLYNLFDLNQSLKGPRINLGGDHSMSIATVADSLNRYNRLKVIWMDAHCDINTYHTSLTKNFHGMPLSFITGLEHEHSMYRFANRILDYCDILYVGIRDPDPFEEEVMKTHKIQSISIDDIHSDPYQSWVTIKKFIGNSPVHLSFDVDVLDPSLVPCTGTPVSKGLHVVPCKFILEELLKEQLVAVDIVELNLDLGTSMEQQNSIRLIQKLFEGYLF